MKEEVENRSPNEFTTLLLKMQQKDITRNKEKKENKLLPDIDR